MVALATQADVEALIGRSLSDVGQEIRVARLLDMASDLFRTACGQTISAVTDDVVDIAELPEAWDLWLPERPVTAVASIVLNGTTLDPAGYRVYRLGLVRRVGWIRWNSWGVASTITVTYSHGYPDDAIPNDIVMRVAEMVASAIANPLKARSTNDVIDGYTHAVSFGNMGMTLDEDDPVVKLYRPQITSVQLATESSVQ